MQPPYPFATHRSFLRAGCITVAVVAYALAPNAIPPAIAGTSDGTWSEIGPPAVRHGTSLIFDPLRDEVVVFGGSPRRSDCWTLTVGASPTWFAVPSTGSRPSDRERHTAVHDPVRNRMIVFGGDDGSGVDYENGVHVLPLGSAVWSLLAPTGTLPLGRADHTMVYDSIRDRLIVFGGIAEFQRFADVPALSLSGTPGWSQVVAPGSGPSARHGHVAIFDPVGDRMIVFGGADDSTRNDVWSLNLSGIPAWNQLSTLGDGPPPTTEATAVYDPTPGRLVLFGGNDGTGLLSNEVWTLSLDSLRWSQLEPTGSRPTSRDRHAATYDGTRDRMLLFGGSDPNRENDIWALDLSSTPAWSELPDLGTPWDRAAHVAVYDPLNQRMVLFGGTDGTLRNSTRALALTGTQRWSTLNAPAPLPAARIRFGGIHDPVRDRMIIFGGWDQTTFFNDTWALSLSGSPIWNAIDPPGPRPSIRMEHAVVYDSRRDRMVMIGGYQRNDAWALPLSGTPGWTLLNPTGAFPYYRGIVAVYDPVGDRAIVFNAVPSEWDSELEAWELTFGESPQWNRLSTTGLSHRGHWGIAAIYDPVRHRVVLMDGDLNSGRPAATTELALATLAWRVLAPAGPIPGRRGYHSAVYDSHRDRMLITGHADGEPYSESNTWRLTWGDPVKPQVVCANDAGEQQDSLNVAYVVTHPLPGTRAVEWTLRSNRDWPGFPARGYVLVEGGAPETLNVSMALPDTAAAGRVQLHLEVALSGATGNVNFCDHEVVIAVTPTLAAVVAAEALEDRVRVRWHVSGEGSVAVERRTSESLWTRILELEPDGQGYVVFEDLDVEKGANYGYRLAWNSEGRAVTAGEIWVQLPSQLRLSLAGMTPNPAHGPLAVAFTLPTRGSATVEVLDVAGRTTGVGQRLDLAAGYHVVALGENRPLAPGIYLVRLQFAGRVLHRRAVVLR